MAQSNKILYCSCLCSERLIQNIYSTSKIKPLYSIQKFHRLLAIGFHLSHYQVTTLSSVPISSENHSKKWWPFKTDHEDGIDYNYLPFLNFPFIRQAFISISTFFYVSFWSIKNKRDNPIIIVDILNVAISSSSLLAARLFGIKVCAIVTDIPQILRNIGEKKRTLINRLSTIVSSGLISFYDGYIILTQQMNDLINPTNKPSIVMEGMVDYKMQAVKNLAYNKANEKIIIYAGGLFEEYGIKKLLEAFIQINDSHLRLHIYGAGPMTNSLQYYTDLDKRIKYFGVVPNSIIVEKLFEATLLVNPRPSIEEFTKYSFPSKNLEYMVSGTPLVTTPLPGMPKEYYDYVYIFSNESISGICTTLKSLLSLPKEELNDFGQRAKHFVLKHKSNIHQSKRIIEFIKTV